MDDIPQINIKVQAKIVKAPAHLGYCEKCYWWRGVELDCYEFPNGQVVMKQLAVAQGVVPPQGTKTVKTRWCTFMPMWNVRTQDSWCAQFNPGEREADER